MGRSVACRHMAAKNDVRQSFARVRRCAIAACTASAHANAQTIEMVSKPVQFIIGAMDIRQGTIFCDFLSITMTNLCPFTAYLS